MPEVTPEMKLAALARAAGWDDMSLVSLEVNNEYEWLRPFHSYDDAHVLLMRLVERLGEGYEFRVADWFIVYPKTYSSADATARSMLRVSPSVFCNAMFAALPECGECGGEGTAPTGHHYIGQGGSAEDAEETCLVCHGSGKTTGEKKVSNLGNQRTE